MSSALNTAITDMLKQYSSDQGLGLHIRPYMDFAKATAFVKRVKEWLSLSIDVNDLHVLVDDSFDGSATKGLGITSSHLLISSGDKQIAAYNISKVISTSMSGWVNRYITVNLSDSESVIFQFGYLNKKCAMSVVEIVQKVGNLTRSHRNQEKQQKPARSAAVISIAEISEVMSKVPELIDVQSREEGITCKYIDKDGDALTLIAVPLQEGMHTFLVGFQVPSSCSLATLVAANSWNMSVESGGTFAFMFEGEEDATFAVMATPLMATGIANSDNLVLAMRDLVTKIDVYQSHVLSFIEEVGEDGRYLKSSQSNIWGNLGQLGGAFLGALLISTQDEN